jgi:acyl-CoA synthetase (AMP-forming)/AMP-acid ligase II
VRGSQPLRACGMPLPFAELQIWDENNKPVPPGESVDPRATAERIVDGDGSMRMATSILLDRADDMVISGGFNIYPVELANAIAADPAVVEVAVFGIPDPKWGETSCAVVCVKLGTSVTEKELVELCSVHLGNYKRPGKVVPHGS